jgi:ABC-type branched-subunit amino acid transport system substrate-binding protein
VDAFARPLLESLHGKVSPIVGVVGPACSLSALSVGDLSGRSEIALINIPLAGTHRLQNRTRYPYSFSILDSSSLSARALVSLAKSSNWERAAVLQETSRQFFTSIAQMIEGLKDINVTSTFLEPVGISSTTLSPAISVMNNFRVIILLVGTDLLSKIMCIAHQDGYTYPTYQFVVHSDVLEAVSKVDFKVDRRSYQCSREEVRKTLNGSIFIHKQVMRPDDEMITSSGISLQTFNERYESRTNNITQPSLFGAVAYDAVWSLVLALNATMATADLGTYGRGQPNVTNLIADEIVSTPFEGLSGRVNFNNETGNIKQNAQFFVITMDGTMLLSYYNEETDNITLYNSTRGTENIFIKDTFDEIILTVPRPLAYFILLLLLVAFLLTLTLNVATCAYRKVNSVKASSIKLSQVAFLGCYILALSLLLTVLVYGFTDKISGAVCKLQHALDISVSVGLTLLLGAIYVRIWRLYKIFNHYMNPGKLLSDQYLIFIITIAVIIDLALTVPAVFVNEYRVDEERVGRKESAFMVVLTCRRIPSIAFFLWFLSSLAVSAVLLSIIFIFAILTRKIPQKNFKTKSIMYLSYTLTGVVPLTIGIYFILTSLEGYTNMVLRCCALCSFLLCLILLPCAMLFFPPFIPMLSRRKVYLLQ